MNDQVLAGHFLPLSISSVHAIHAAALRILDEIGVRVELEEALRLLSGGGARVDGAIVRIPPALVERALALAPRRIAPSLSYLDRRFPPPAAAATS